MRAPDNSVTMLPMTDPDMAQAAVLIAALQDQLDEMVPKLARAEQVATIDRPERAGPIRLDAKQLRRDVNQARNLIAQLQRRFPEVEITGHTLGSDVPAIDLPTMYDDGEGRDLRGQRN